MAYAGDSKSPEGHPSCGFKSHRRHQPDLRSGWLAAVVLSSSAPVLRTSRLESSPTAADSLVLRTSLGGSSCGHRARSSFGHRSGLVLGLAEGSWTTIHFALALPTTSSRRGSWTTRGIGPCWGGGSIGWRRSCRPAGWRSTSEPVRAWTPAGLRGRGLRAIGLDFSLGMLRAGAAEFPGARVQGDARRLPFGDGAVAGVWASASLLHLDRDDAQRALGEARRVLRPAGLLFVSVKAGEGAEGERALRPAALLPDWSAEISIALLDSTGFRVVDGGTGASPRADWLVRVAERID